MTLCRSLMFVSGLICVVPSSPAAAQGQTATRPVIRFQEMDANGDRVITRREWTGTNGSFRLHDTNRDGVLSGDEISLRYRGRQHPGDFDSANREYPYDDWSAAGFSALDHNRDNRISPEEWHFDRESFRRADHNRDNVISRSEFLSEDDLDDDRGDDFSNLDADGDRRIGRGEWHGSQAVFQALDENHDGFVTRGEMRGSDAPDDLFTSVDVNRDGHVALAEWHWARAAFDRLDLNHDQQLSPQEFQGRASSERRGQAYRSGYDRGVIEGKAAGREDRDRNQGWDLEGQRELETADSGYTSDMGSKMDYQAGYREGFRAAYREGWERR